MAASSDNLQSCVTELLENDCQVYEKARKTLLRIMDNIISNSGIEKYRKIKLSSVVVSDNLLPANGGLSCLWAAGFVEDSTGEYLVLPMQAELSNLQTIHRQIQSHEQPLQQKSAANKTVSNKPVAAAASSSQTETNKKTSSKWPKWKWPTLPSNIGMLEIQFYNRMKTSFDHVLVYENRALQEKAIQCIPKERLTKNATQKFAASQGSKFNLLDFYMIELMDWYRDEFFSWVSAPDCEHCEGKTQQVGSGQPSSDDIRWGAHRVELYKCTQCGKNTRFPRYNDPGRLLETRRGRCGEWANCFTLICRASGYEARHLLDWTDHVWTEVYSQSQQRWLHCDPGEKALDKPLLYESGWGKKLTYIIAFSKDDINDVTWRYSADHQALILRRTQCRESWLTNAIKTLRDERQRDMSDIVKRVLQLRLIKEGAEFIDPKRKGLSAGEMIGRLTGSVEWREARGEMGTVSVSKPHYTFSPSDEEVSRGCMEVMYCCSTNYYSSSLVKESMHDWKSGVYEYTGIDRTVEVDWNMTYLARGKHSATSSVSWNFDVSSKGKTIQQVTIHVCSTTFHSGCIVWRAEDNLGNKSVIRSDVKQTLEIFKGSTSVRLSAELSSGDGNDAWQHTQLFRQKRNDTKPMMTLSIQFL